MRSTPSVVEPSPLVKTLKRAGLLAYAGFCLLIVTGVYWATSRPAAPVTAAVGSLEDVLTSSAANHGRPPRLSEPTDAMPLRTAAAPLTAESVATVDPTILGVRTAGNTAGPLDRLLSDELPHATDSERDVWRDVLTGVPLSDAREIVRFRKNFGPPSVASQPTSLAAQTAVLPPPAALPPEAVASAQPASEAETSESDRIANVYRHNVSNMLTPGFLALEPVITEAPIADGGRFPVGGVRLSGIRVAANAADVEPHETGDNADVAAPAGRFLCVIKNGRRRLARCGRVVAEAQTPSLDVNGTVVPLDGAAGNEPQTWPVYQVRSVPGLRPCGGCLYAATDASGPITEAEQTALVGVSVSSSSSEDTEQMERVELWRTAPLGIRP